MRLAKGLVRERVRMQPVQALAQVQAQWQLERVVAGWVPLWRPEQVPEQERVPYGDR